MNYLRNNSPRRRISHDRRCVSPKKTKTYEQQLDEALEHRRTLHEGLVNRAAEYRAGVGLYKRKMEEFDASLEEIERKLFRAMRGFQLEQQTTNSVYSVSMDLSYDQQASCSNWKGHN